MSTLRRVAAGLRAIARDLGISGRFDPVAYWSQPFPAPPHTPEGT